MKTSCIFLVACILIPIRSWSQPMVKDIQVADNLCTELDGAWIYDLPDQEGMYFSAKGRVLWVLFPKNRANLDPATASHAQKARAFEGMNFMAGTWTCEGQRGTVHREYAADPTLAGTSFSFDFERDRDMSMYWVSGEKGNRPADGRSHRVARLDTPTACGHEGGFWRYDLPDMEGYFAIAGNYYAWVLVNKAFWSDPPDLSSDAGKAAAYDAISLNAGTYACDGKGNWSWNQTFPKNPAASSNPIYTKVAINGPETRWWFFDGDGERIQPGGRAVKVE